jgi:long-chain acyl-CoA synthetase
MLGDRRKFPSIIVVPNFEQLEKWAKLKNLIWTDRRQLVSMPIVRTKMEKEVFGQVDKLAHFEQPKKVALLDQEMTVESGELTPTLKVKRKLVNERYRSLIDGMYAEGAAG